MTDKRFISLVLLAVAVAGHAQDARAQALDDLSPRAIQERVGVGDAVRATVKDGRTFDLTIVKVEAESLTGTRADNRRFRIRYAVLASLEVLMSAGGVEELGPEKPGPTPARAPARRDPPKTADGARAWVGLGVGLVWGDVEVPCDGLGAGDCSEGGVFTSFNLNVTVAGPFAARLRAVHANEDTSKPPLEVAALVGPRVGDVFYVMVGASNVSHPDDDYSGDAKGVAWELLFAPAGSSVEFSLHGASGGDLDYSGLSLAVRLGNRR